MAKTIVGALGAIFVLIGIWGFFQDPVFGIFEVDVVHNIVHLASGALALYFASRGEESARTFAKVFAVVYGLVAILGFILPGEHLLGIMHVNMADNWLHVILTLAFAYAGFASGRDRMTA